MSSKKEWKQAAERRLMENLALRMRLAEVEIILNKPSENLAQAKKRIRRALRKIAARQRS